MDTTTDVYSLGVMLYELLVGALPFDPIRLRRAGYGEIQRIIREEDPPRPSTRLSGLGAKATEVAHQRHTDISALERELKGDLDWIALKAMEKDRTMRYPSASELAADIRRHLRLDPVSARPASFTYRLRKFVGKHRLGVTSAALIVVALATGMIVSVAMYFRAKAAGGYAERKAYTSTLALVDMEITGADGVGNQKDVLVAQAERNLAEIPERLRGWEWGYLARRIDGSMATLWGAEATPLIVFPVTDRGGQ